MLDKFQVRECMSGIARVFERGSSSLLLVRICLRKSMSLLGLIGSRLGVV